MYDKESEMSLRMAHKLNSTVCDPNNIQQVIGQNSNKSIFWLNSSCYGIHVLFKNSSCIEGNFFLKLVTEMSKKMNVKNSKIGSLKKDTLRTPVHSARDHRLKHLEELALFFKRWRESRKTRLTAQTFKAAELMCRSFNCETLMFPSDKLFLACLLH